MKTFLAIDIGGTYIKYGLVDENAAILESGRESTPKGLLDLLHLIDGISQKYPQSAGIAVSAPGAVGEDGIIYGSSALPYLHGPNIKQLLKEKTKKPVYLENDANCAAYAEIWKGAAQGMTDIMVMVIGTGIGGSIIKDGILHKGAHLHGGEFGYMLLDSSRKGSNDTWSRQASTAALVRNVADAKQIPEDSLTGEQIFAMAEAGDQDCIQALDQFYHLLAVGIYNLQYVYDPEIILIGGGISAREDLITMIDDKLNHILSGIPHARIKPPIAACHFRQHANLVGAVYGFMIENKS
ncbi:ROK family protein [Peribacillus sp. FSL H8-0477]|uniref:ROK family protein n=1 Tax=Peribacillus sp. FSL H8-0477 TaxID=2921388 RepID=UPI0030FD143C